MPFPNKDDEVLYSNDIKDLILKLLNKDPDKRLGYENGSVDILDHPLFKKFNLEMIKNHLIRPSIKPYIKEFSKTNFDTEEHKNKMIKAGEGMTHDDVNLCIKHAAEFECFERFIKKKEESKK
jgi:serine/threonine protein kinase